MRMYIGNLSQDVDEEELKRAFGAFGTLKSAIVIKDEYSGFSKGFGFVEFLLEQDAKTAMARLNACVLKGQEIIVNEVLHRASHNHIGMKKSGD